VFFVYVCAYYIFVLFVYTNRKARIGLPIGHQ